jgi:glucuronoarabinoxylan endo-1,4-beta-xylanase
MASGGPRLVRIHYKGRTMRNASYGIGANNVEGGSIRRNRMRIRRVVSAALIGIVSIPLLGQATAADAADVTVNVSSQKQVIDGYGASSAWSGALSDNIMNSLYKTLGFSILRLRINEDIGDNWKSGPFSSWADELSNAKKAAAAGAIVFATPWNPPASLRLTGGCGQYSTDPSKWASYRDYLNAYVKYMKDNGVNLYAISVQNEPDYSKSWTCWTATQDHDFVLNYGASITTKLISAEAFAFDKSYYDQILNDSKALANVAIMGTHLYGTQVKDFAYPLFESKGRPAGVHLWMTEHYIGEKETDVNIANTVAIGKEIHDCMVTGNMSGYTYWWIPYGNGLTTSSGTLYQRAFAIGQFSKHIRKGYYRVDATAAPATGLYVSAYSGADSVVIVAVNTGTGSVNQKFMFQGATVDQFARYETSSGKNMVTGTPVSVAGGSFTTSLPAQSITTFVGKNTSTFLERRIAASEFKTALTNGNIVVTPLKPGASYDVTVQMVNGRQVGHKRGAQGVFEIPAGARGTYAVDIESEGGHLRKMVLSY